MSHHVLHVRREQRIPVLVDLTSAPGRKVVFTRTKHGAKALARQLNRSGIPTVDLHGNLSQGARTRNMEAFHSGRATTLVATDVAARGIHVDDVSLVVHADPPSEHKAYLHRSGRTARAGAEGTVVTLDDRRAGPRRPRPDPCRRHPGDHDQGRRRCRRGAPPPRSGCPFAPRRVRGGCSGRPVHSAQEAQAAPRPGRRRRVGTPAASGPSVGWPQPWPTSRPGRPRSGQVRAVTSAQRGLVQLAGSLTGSSGTLVHHVRVARRVREAELLVEMHRRRVVGLDVEQDLVEAQGAQVSQADVDQRAARGRGPGQRGRSPRRTPRPASRSAAWSSGSRASGRPRPRRTGQRGRTTARPSARPAPRRPSNPARGGGRTRRR